ncbi:Ger(x)C family spore germination protein [Paenibacillus glycanilyticus]|uniref:Spore germination protein YfkR n=1 Tax=Paenibacillus glycanilyticus TaxID=126569 RepID=A0ABQ6GBJ4_9BACL|nr:Ger(x)C family spore germination protein [Paenibacillus glycanilyticus]GLX67875.1 putative spore germination protein YfkR [Paenibacillus glycanilyticus]
MKPLLPLLRICLILLLFLTGGCWDRTEINDLAFITGSAFDLTEKGDSLLSLQFAIPSSSQDGGQGGEPNKFFVMSATGKNVSDAFEKIQKKSSRKLFTSHRSVIFIGESLGRKGINDVLDVFAHDPHQRLKTYIMVVKGGEAKQVLEAQYPYDQVPMEAVKEMEAQQSEVAVTLRDFFMAASSRGIYPIMGVIEAESEGAGQSKTSVFRLSGAAVFKNLKLIGMLNGYETNGLNWLKNHMEDGRINAELPDGKGSVSMVVAHANRTITSKVKGDQIQFKIVLQAKGPLFENNSNLNVSRPQNLALIQHSLEEAAERQVQEVIVKLQKRYQTDAIGLGRELYRSKPRAWQAVQAEWDRKFAEADISVDVKLSISSAGMAGPPLQLNEKEIMN